jgi:hypothetical protein
MANFRISTAMLCVLLVAEVALVISLRALGWLSTGNVILTFAWFLVATMPLLIIVAMVAVNKFRFGVRSLLGIVALAAVFLYLSVLPVLDYRAQRRVSIKLTAENARLNLLSLDDFYSRMGLEPPPTQPSTSSSNVPPWLEPFTEHLSDIPPDHLVHMIGVDSDQQVRTLAENWRRFPALQSIEITSGVTDEGLEVLLTMIKRFNQLDFIHLNSVTPPKNWYGSLTNVRTLFVWGEGSARGTTLPQEHVVEIASLPNLETFMVLGYAFTDADARRLAKSPSLKRIILRGTAVTPSGESYLHDEAANRLVYRN